MSLRDEAKDPWSYVVAGLGGGFAWAVLASITAAAGPIGVAVGAGMLAVKLLGGAFVPGSKTRRLQVHEHTDEAAWLDRARQAERSFRDIAGSAPEGPIAERVRAFGAETTASIASLERLAGQASAIRTGLNRIDPRRAAAERDRIAATTDGEDRQRALDAVQGQLDAYQRLTAALGTLLGRLQSGTLALEGLVARLAEVVALTETSGTAADGLSEVDSLATELEGLRAGLVEAESVSRQAVDGLAPLPTGSVQQRRRATE